MKRTYAIAIRAAGIGLLCVVPFGSNSLGDGGAPVDSCEMEARRAYWQALKICQLAENPNPRLRCYEAAQSVYWHVLEECHTAQRGLKDAAAVVPKGSLR